MLRSEPLTFQDKRDRGERITTENLLQVRRAQQLDPPASGKVLVNKPNSLNS